MREGVVVLVPVLDPEINSKILYETKGSECSIAEERGNKH